jgi:hypothetical protein
MEITDPASTELDCDSIEPGSFHPDSSLGATSRDIRATRAAAATVGEGRQWHAFSLEPPENVGGPVEAHAPPFEVVLEHPDPESL